MAAVIDFRTGLRLAPQRSAPSRPPAPSLRVIHGGRSVDGRRMRRVYLVRRVVLAAVLVLAVVVAASAVRVAGSSSAAPASSPTISGRSYVVQPGDTLWAIATAIEPDADPRRVVDRLIELNAGDGPSLAVAPLEVGRELTLAPAVD